MTKTQKNKQKVIDTLTDIFGEPDTYGHFKFTGSEGKTYRVKMQKFVYRLEAKSIIMGRTHWTRLQSVSFNDTYASQIARQIKIMLKY